MLTKKTKGFTLIELVVVIVILGILSVVALPRFIDLSSDARISTLTQLEASVKGANNLLFMKSHMPSYTTRAVPGRPDLLDIDMDHDGDFEVFSPDNIDVRLKERYLDNTDVIKRIDISDVFKFEYEGIDYTYIGYDLNNDSQVKNDACYFKYTQAQSPTVPAAYEIVNTGC
ncbi:prepilin-type N-terminal cleavage/methylation domain-containing protein [Colwellia sp. KU-HH00111]|uniref:type II secretion system protein n=1 Tax=Colwellia sp. KU-HH00111 TaxID=3127652 RepID=UPI003105A35F